MPVIVPKLLELLLKIQLPVKLPVLLLKLSKLAVPLTIIEIFISTLLSNNKLPTVGVDPELLFTLVINLALLEAVGKDALVV